jgi:dTDP-4-amino-4,6-dideoxygalactose transaminase
MKVPFLDLSRIHTPIQEDLNSVFHEELERSYFVYGQSVSDFEGDFADYLGVDYCVSTGNCTDALQLTLHAFGVGIGDEVILPAMTWITDAEVVSNLGAMPVFADVKADGNIDVSHIETLIGPHTKAIIAVHLYGKVCDVAALKALADEHDLVLIEDCAQASGAKYNGQSVGQFGDAAVFSFYPTKNLGALGDAGCMVTDDKSLGIKVRKLANHGAADKHSHEFPGSNSRMDSIQAAVLRLKLQLLRGWNQSRREAAEYYIAALSGIGMHLPAMDNHVFHVFSVLTEKRDELKSYLKDQGVQTQIHYPKALPFTQAYADFGFSLEDFPVAYRLQNESLSLPLFPGIREEELAYVVEQIKMFFNHSL